MKKNIKKSLTHTGLTFQQLIMELQRFWSERGCVIQQPYDIEVGAGTMHPETFFRVLGPDPYRVSYVQPSRRPTDGRYGENPNRLYKHTQYQVILKPIPKNIQDLYLDSLVALGIDLQQHDIRFEEDNWEAPTLGAWGVGWQVLLDGLEITQFTYFQQCGGLNLDPPSVELTYGLERIAAFLQDVSNVFDLRWTDQMTYGQVRLAEEQQFSAYSFEVADASTARELFDMYEREALSLLSRFPDTSGAERERFPVLAAYDLGLKCSHLFNVLDSRRAISTTERAAMISRVRAIACRAAEAYLAQRGQLPEAAPAATGAERP
ncbi:MAG TPA: glycine--tRNA ligase subunit alpha [Candidatus Dormibacteraeota bacterium]|nr:glycine--tRNA ligase subunit alpha [Candidatus Dormibacteraeota bacterium]